MKDLLRAAIAFFSAAILSLNAAAAADPLLTNLEGHWVGVGTVEGEAVTYDAEGRFALQGEFLVLSMIDADDPPAYEAAVFLARSAKKGDYVAHWLDNFGADGARVVGFGAGADRKLEITFDYAEATFRDRFEFAPGGRKFTLVVDSRAGDGPWEEFASYVFTRTD